VKDVSDILFEYFISRKREEAKKIAEEDDSWTEINR